MFSICYIKYLILLLLVLIPLQINAITLGNVKVNSFLNQNLDVQIEVISSEAILPENIKSFIASKKIFMKYDLPYYDIFSHFRFTASNNRNGKIDIHLTSSKIIREPLLSFVLGLRVNNSISYHEYDLFINPSPRLIRHNRRNNKKKPLVARQTNKTSDNNSKSKTYARKTITKSNKSKNSKLDKHYPIIRTLDPVKPGSSLSLIAQTIRPDNTYSISKISKYLYQINPQAFNGNINNLKLGYSLKVPDLKRPEFRMKKYVHLDQQEVALQEIVQHQMTTSIKNEKGMLSLLAEDNEVEINQDPTEQELNKIYETKQSVKTLKVIFKNLKSLENENKLLKEKLAILLKKVEQVNLENEEINRQITNKNQAQAESQVQQQNAIKNNSDNNLVLNNPVVIKSGIPEISNNLLLAIFLIFQVFVILIILWRNKQQRNNKQVNASSTKNKNVIEEGKEKKQENNEGFSILDELS
jgi:pilus assembly protein FimV